MKLLWLSPLIPSPSRQMQTMNNDVLRMCCLSNLTKFKIDRTRLRYCYDLLDY